MTEQEQTELRERAEKGRKAKIASEFLDEFLAKQRAFTLQDLETNKEKITYEDLLFSKIFLIVLRSFENMLNFYINNGEIAEKELNNNGE
ncbi:MAG: hypothetical protein IJ859_07015 [Synergistaceae bacterium]|nr:hypothetical protein [Synergistaceae bacterium]